MRYYALVSVTKPKKKECAIRLDRKTQFSFLIQLHKTVFVWVQAVLENYNFR